MNVLRNPSTPEPDAEIGKVDLDYWASMTGWRIRELAALLLSLDPAVQCDLDQSPQFARLYKRLNRARVMKELPSPLAPRCCLDWAASNDIWIPPQLLSAVKKGKPLRNWKKISRRQSREIDRLKRMADDEVTNSKSKRSLLTILLCVAQKHYRHVRTGNSPAPANIANTINSMSTKSISDETVRKWLAEAEELVGEDVPAV